MPVASAPKTTPLIALFGLPNSGKSTLLNRLSSTKKAIVAKEAHTTRDLNYVDATWDGLAMKLVDTGGLVPETEDNIQKQIQVKSWAALQQADILVWVIERRQNPETITDAILSRVWKLGKPVLIVINKVDDPNQDKEVSPYARLGGFDFVNVSAVNGYGLNDLLDILVEKAQEMGFEKSVEEGVVDNQKVRANRSKSKLVVQDKEGGYQVVRERADGGIPGLFESYRTREVEHEIPNIVLKLEGVALNQEGQVEEQTRETLTQLRASGKKVYFWTQLPVEQLQALQTSFDLQKYFDGGVIAGAETTVSEVLAELFEEYDSTPEQSVFVDDEPGVVDLATQAGYWTILHSSYYALGYILERIEGMEYGFVERLPATPKIILLGKPNVGKSSLFNALAEEDLQIVTDTAGTTLSVNDYLLKRTIRHRNKVTGEESTREKDYILLDTTGIRKPGQRTFGAESFATYRTIEATYEADVVCLIVDGSQPLTHQDQVVAGIAHESRNGLVVIINKADLLDDEAKQQFLRSFHQAFRFLKVQEFVWVSAKNKENLGAIWKAIDTSLYQRKRLISRGEVRKLFNYLMKQKPPKKLRTKKRPVIYDLVYTDTEPPTFELLIKDKTSIHWSYVRFLENIIRNQFGFEGTGIKLKVVQVNRKDVVN